MNEICQTTATTLQDIKETMATVHDDQQRMWATIERMNQELQELIYGDAGTDGGEDANPVPPTMNMDEQGPISDATISVFPQPIVAAASSTLGYQFPQSWRKKRLVRRIL